MPRSLRTVLFPVLLACLAGVASASVTGLGSAAILEVDDLLIVYPAGDDARAASHRAAAEAKAAFFRRSKGMTVDVKPDLEWIPADRSRSQLWLGWDNRAFDRAELERPFRRASDGRFVFLGHEGGRRDDLLFTFPNPWTPGAVLAFWSRLDPALDRLSIIPVLGSDWAIYDAFLPTRQGMFLPVDDWPPRTNPEASIDHRPALDTALESWDVRSAGGVTLRFDPERIDAEAAGRLLSARVAAWNAAADALGLDPKGTVEIHVYADREQKVRFTGNPDAVHTIPDPGRIHLLQSVAGGPGFHEELHVRTERAWGAASLATFYEGRAIEREDRFDDVPLRVHAAAWVERARLPGVQALFRAGATYFETPGEGRALLPAAALFLRWLGETHGETAARRAYVSSPGSERAFARALSRDLSALEREFHDWLAALGGVKDETAERMKALATAERLYRAGDWNGLADHLETMREEAPDDLSLAHNLANAWIRAERWPEAEALLQEVVRRAAVASDRRHLLVGWYDLGRVRDYMGKRDAAIDAYREVLALPDERGMHALAQTGIFAPLKPGEGR